MGLRPARPRRPPVGQALLGRAEDGPVMPLNGLDRALKESASPPRRRRRTRIGWRQVAAQVLFVATVTAFVLALLAYGVADW